MNVTLTDQSLKNTMKNSPFQWDPKSLKYLGIKLTPQIHTIFEHNFPPLLKAIERDLDKWHAGFFSWFGRATIVKMTILPRILYFLRILPVKLPRSMFNTLRVMLLRFIWAHKKSRIKYETLLRMKDRGGWDYPTLGITTCKDNRFSFAFCKDNRLALPPRHQRLGKFEKGPHWLPFEILSVDSVGIISRRPEMSPTDRNHIEITSRDARKIGIHLIPWSTYPS